MTDARAPGVFSQAAALDVSCDSAALVYQDVPQLASMR
jgi:hypothetical protein